MNDTKNPGDALSIVPAKTLTLKRPVEAGIVRQSFSHGRSKAVVVEKVKRRAIAPGEGMRRARRIYRRRPLPPRNRTRSQPRHARNRRCNGRRPGLFCVR